MPEKVKKIYADSLRWQTPIRPDDFIVMIGQRKSNSVYHVVSARQVDHPKTVRMVRTYLEVLDSSLIDLVKRDKSQRVHPKVWYPRGKKPKK